MSFRSFTFQTQKWFNADRWYRIEFAEDYVNGNVASNCPANNGHNFDLMCCPVALSNRASNLRSGVNKSVGTSSGQVCNIDNSNLESWYASGAITEFFAHPSNTSSPNYNSNQQNGTYTFGNVVRAHRNSLNTFNFNISAANATIQLHVARPPVLNPIYDINYNLLPSTSLWAANTSNSHNILVENNRTFQFSSGLDWQNPLPSVTPVQTAGTTLSIHPNSQTFYNQGYYMGLLVNQIPNNSTIPNCKQLMACVVYIDFEPMNLTVTSASCNDRNTRICGISSTVAQISISTNHGQNWQSYPVNGGCVVLPFHQNQHGNGFTVLVRDPYTCQIYTLNVPSANLRCCESIHFGNNCVSNISNYNYVYLNNPSNQPNQRRKVSMSGDIRINTDVVINNCEIIMLPGSRIWMEAGKKLTITNSHIRACDTLWQGIRTTNATNNNAQIIIDNSTIEDAFSAVEAYSATINVRNSTFRNNYNHLNVILSQIAPLENNIFTCQMNNQANSGRIKPHYLGGHCHNLLPMTPPNNNRVTQTAVSIAWCSNTVIMNNNIFERAYTGLNISDGNYVLNHTGLDEHKNRFRNLHQYGILGNVINPNNSNSKITMVNNQFSNIKNTLPTSLPNVLIFSTAVRISGFNLEAKANRFSNIAFVSIYADKKTRRFNDPPRTYDIQNNTFSYGGVIDIFAVDNPYAVFEIQGNEFLGKLNANTTAVYIANVFTQTYLHNEPVTLVNNKVVNKSRGFYLAQVFPQLIENNLIRLSDINPNQNRNFGIKVENTGIME
ncbi:MAG: hypothetical protein KatS3mg035_2013 [Bacteroidia bacterium]|nr:MAG: hypothetical protein KatS3mg035_2013 [Bacteroidia bacterium]